MDSQKKSQTNTPFREKVYLLAKQIPQGKVATYGQLAAMVGSSGGARAVGVCMKENPDPENIPCHRVVASDGKLTGYAFGGITRKKDILKKEGVSFINDRVNLQISKWQPPLTLVNSII